MPRTLRVVFLVATLVTLFVAADSGSGQASSAAPTGLALTAASAAPLSVGQVEELRMSAAERKAIQAELEQRLEQAQKEVAALQARHDATADYALRRALQQRIEAAKREQELDFFRIQLRYAQAAGRLEQVRELEAVLDAQLKQPVAPLLPLPAAAPAAPAARTARPSRPVKGGGR